MSKATIKIGNMTVPADITRKELLKFLVENKALLMAEKKAAIKYADAIEVDTDIISKYCVDREGKLTKAAAGQEPVAEGNTVLCVINTTLWMDSHSDVHINGLWNKSIKDNKTFTHLQEHNMSFSHVISDEAKGYVEKLTWKELGLNISGTTEALIFASPLKGRNPFMEEQYKKGFVKNHSVGMRYVTLKLCVNEPDEEYYKEEYANWTQYFPMVANADEAEAQGYFWAVLEAKIIEGSAVVKGSNVVTPTLGYKSSVQPEKSTEQNQPVTTTEVKDDKTVDWDKIAKSISF